MPKYLDLENLKLFKTKQVSYQGIMVNEKGALEQRFSILSQEIDALSSRLGSILPGRLFRVHLANH